MRFSPAACIHARACGAPSSPGPFAESHLRELLEQGFEIAVVKDAAAGPRHPEIGDGYKAALVNYGFLANAVLTTAEVVNAMR